MESNHVKKPSTLTVTCILIWWESVATRKGLSLFFFRYNRNTLKRGTIVAPLYTFFLERCKIRIILLRYKYFFFFILSRKSNESEDQ